MSRFRPEAFNVQPAEGGLAQQPDSDVGPRAAGQLTDPVSETVVQQLQANAGSSVVPEGRNEPDIGETGPSNIIRQPNTDEKQRLGDLDSGDGVPDVINDAKAENSISGSKVKSGDIVVADKITPGHDLIPGRYRPEDDTVEPPIKAAVAVVDKKLRTYRESLDGRQIGRATVHLLLTEVGIQERNHGKVIEKPPEDSEPGDLIECIEKDPNAVEALLKEVEIEPTGFWGAVVRADTKEFRETIAEHRAEGLEGAMHSLYRQIDEMPGDKRAKNTIKLDAQDVGKVRNSFHGNINQAYDETNAQGVKRGPEAAFQLIRNRIYRLDNEYRTGHGKYQGSPHTESRKLAWAVIQHDYYSERGKKPQAHATIINTMRGIIDQRLADYEGLVHTANPGAPAMEVPEDIYDAEALLTKMGMEYALEERKGEAVILQQLLKDVSRMDQQSSGIADLNKHVGNEGIYTANVGPMTPQRARLMASSLVLALKVSMVLQGSKATGDAKAEAIDNFRDEVLGQRAVDKGNWLESNAGRLTLPELGAMDAEQLVTIGDNYLQARAAEGATGYVDPRAIETGEEIRGFGAALEIDPTGTMDKNRMDATVRRGREKLLELHPEAGSVLVVHGDITNPKDGRSGAIEELVADSGIFTHIDHTGPKDPLKKPQRLSAIRNTLAGENTVIGDPLDPVPDYFKWYWVMLDGQQDYYGSEKQFLIGLLLGQVSPGGLSTVSYRDNPELCEDLIAHINDPESPYNNPPYSNHGVGMYSIINDDVIRIVGGESSNRIKLAYGSVDPDQREPNRILAIFHNKADGSHSDLFEQLKAQLIAIRRSQNNTY